MLRLRKVWNDASFEVRFWSARIRYIFHMNNQIHWIRLRLIWSQTYSDSGSAWHGMAQLLTTASCRTEWKISAESPVMSPPTTQSVKGLKWTELTLRLWPRGDPHSVEFKVRIGFTFNSTVGEVFKGYILTHSKHKTQNVWQIWIPSNGTLNSSFRSAV